jgi:toxin ParE1/3/4
VARYRLAATALEQIGGILDWSEEQFGAHARERYEELLLTAMQDVADTPKRANVTWMRLTRMEIGVYHIAHSRERASDPPGIVGEPRHYLVFRVGQDGVVDVLGFVHERMLLNRALRKIVRSESAKT